MLSICTTKQAGEKEGGVATTHVQRYNGRRWQEVSTGFVIFDLSFGSLGRGSASEHLQRESVL